MAKISGSDLLREIQGVWQTDKRDVEDIEMGFNWWPGHHKITVMCFPSKSASDPDALRLTTTTDFLKGVNVEEPKVRALIASMGSLSPSYSWMYTPPEISKQYNLAVDGAIAFHSSSYVRPETATWLPVFFARFVIMQAIDAQRMADPIAEIVGGRANKSGPRFSRGSTPIDDILNVGQAIWSPMGQLPSKWAGSGEFGAIAERYGRSAESFGTGGNDGLSLETSFGKSSSFLRLHHDIKHPALGSGLLGTIRLPVFESLDTSTSTCMWLNFLCSRSWTNAPVHGTWHPREIRKGEFAPSYRAFVPNALYADGIATNLALWNACLARWARLTAWPDLVDDTMYNIIGARLSELNSNSQKT
jgi:hypothetical protein